MPGARLLVGEASVFERLVAADGEAADGDEARSPRRRVGYLVDELVERRDLVDELQLRSTGEGLERLGQGDQADVTAAGQLARSDSTGIGA